MKRMMAMFFVAATMVFAACGDKDNNSDEPQNPQGINLTDRAWKADIQTTYNYQGMVDMDIEASITVAFTNTTEGQLTVYYNISVPIMPTMNREDEQTEAVTYLFDGTTLTLTPTDASQEEGILGDMVMTYDQTENTFIMDIPDESYEGLNLREVLGADHLTFHEIITPEK